MQIKNAFIVMLLAAVTLGLSACASYDHKDYPRESWFAPSTQVISADQFKKVETPLKVALVVNYTWEGRPIVQEPFEERPADWREQYGLELAAARYLEKTGNFIIVDPDDKEKQGVISIDVTRQMDEKTKAVLASKKANQNEYPEKIVYEYDMTMKMELSLTDGKKFEAIPKTDHMFIGHEESGERKVGVNPKRFTFSYFNNMDFHTEFVRRFYKQMIFEGVQQIENELQ